MIDWMNCNQGFIMSILTAVYVVATILIYSSNNKLAKAATEQLEEMKAFQQQNVNIQLFDKRHEVYYILWRWCDISEKSFDDLQNPPVEVFQELLSLYYTSPCEVYYTGNIIGSAKFLYPLECGKAERFRTAFVDMAHEMTIENLQKLKASFEELKKANLLEEMKEYLNL